MKEQIDSLKAQVYDKLYYSGKIKSSWDGREWPLVVALLSMIVFVPCFIGILIEAFGTLWIIIGIWGILLLTMIFCVISIIKRH